MQVAWDLQAVTGPKPTGLGISVAFLKQAFEDHATDCQVTELRPNEHDRPLIGVPDRILWEQVRLPLKLRRAGREQRPDLCYSPALGAPIFSPVPMVAHVHDLIPLNYPQQFSGVAGWYWKRLLPYTWQRCTALTVSNETVADDVSRQLWFDREKIHVVPYYPDPRLKDLARIARASQSRLEQRESDDSPLFITLASLEPRKNLSLPIEAVGLLKQRGIRVRLECIGGHTPHAAELISTAARLDVSDQVSFSGYLDRGRIVEQLLHCTALLFTSSYEGFGMPPLEAMSLGTAVVLSDIPCHRHIYTDTQRLRDCGMTDPLPPTLVDVRDAGTLADEMARLISDDSYRKLKQETGLAYSGTFTARATGQALESAFNSVLNS